MKARTWKILTIAGGISLALSSLYTNYKMIQAAKPWAVRVKDRIKNTKIANKASNVFNKARTFRKNDDEKKAN